MFVCVRRIRGRECFSQTEHTKALRCWQIVNISAIDELILSKHQRALIILRVYLVIPSSH